MTNHPHLCTGPRLLTEVQCALGAPRTILGLDLGSTTGYAVLEACELGHVRVICSGSHQVRRSRDPHEGTGYLELEALLTTQLDGHRPLAVAVEDVRRHRGVRAAHVYGALRGVVALECARRDQILLPIGVGLAKQRATGKGNASKEAMVVAARTLLKVDVIDDNEADALFIALAALDVSSRWQPAAE